MKGFTLEDFNVIPSSFVAPLITGLAKLGPSQRNKKLIPISSFARKPATSKSKLMN